MFPHLSDHTIPDPSYQLAMFAVGDQVEVVRELDVARELFQDVNAEAFTAKFGVWFSVSDYPVGTQRELYQVI